MKKLFYFSIGLILLTGILVCQTVTSGKHADDFDSCSTHFNLAKNTGYSSEIDICGATLDRKDLVVGDEIAVYDGLLCVGAATVSNIITFDSLLTITVWKDNPDTQEIDGYIPGNKTYFRVWQKSTSIETNKVVFYFSDNETGVTKGYFEDVTRPVFGINQLLMITL